MPLGLSSVFGSAKVTQEADNVLIIQQGASAELAGWSNEYRRIEVKKNRFDGTTGAVVFTYDKILRRIKEAKPEELAALASIPAPQMMGMGQGGSPYGSGGSMGAWPSRGGYASGWSANPQATALQQGRRIAAAQAQVAAAAAAAASATTQTNETTAPVVPATTNSNIITSSTTTAAIAAKKKRVNKKATTTVVAAAATTNTADLISS
jgi:hypothetical protein